MTSEAMSMMIAAIANDKAEAQRANSELDGDLRADF